MNKCQWFFNPTPNVEYYHDVATGLVIGQCHPIAHSVIFLAKVWITSTEEKVLGQYVSMLFAKSAVESFWVNEYNTVTDKPVLGHNVPF